MKNADLFKDTFGMYATEIWSMPEKDFLKWLNEDAKQKTGKWIPVSERLPEEGKGVLVWYEYFRFGDYNRMFSTYGIGWQYDEHWLVDNGGMNQRVFAWMPLPEAYKEVD